MKESFDNSNETYLVLKIMLIGKSGVGCKSIKNSFVYEKPVLELGDYNTISVDSIKFYKKNDINFKLKIYSFSGQDRFWGINSSYLKEDDVVVILVYDNNEDSIDTLIEKYKKINKKENKIFCVCKNKMDLNNNGSQENKIKNFLSENKIDLDFKISCKNFNGINEMFDKIIGYYLKKYWNNEINIIDNLHDENLKHNKKNNKKKENKNNKKEEKKDCKII